MKTQSTYIISRLLYILTIFVLLNTTSSYKNTQINNQEQINTHNEKQFNIKEVLLIPLLSVAIGLIVSALILVIMIIINK